jgi:hypothetical protein
MNEKKKYKLSTLIKVGVSILFPVLYECAFIMTNPKYDEHNTKMLDLLKLNFIIVMIGITITLIANIFLGERGKMIFMMFVAAIFINMIYIAFCSIKLHFQIWHTFFKERLEKEDKR